MSKLKAVGQRLNGCADCKHYNPAGLFELCMHERSKYRYDGREDHHTVQHMTAQGRDCGEGRALKQ